MSVCVHVCVCARALWGGVLGVLGLDPARLRRP